MCPLLLEWRRSRRILLKNACCVQPLTRRVSVSSTQKTRVLDGAPLVWRGVKLGMQNAVFTMNYMTVINKFTSIMIFDGRKNSWTHRVYHVMLWAPHIAEQVSIFFANSIFQWYFPGLTHYTLPMNREYASQPAAATTRHFSLPTARTFFDHTTSSTNSIL